ncbi:MAG: phosphate acyltransferase, partial [Myxococcota bacterium]
MPRVIVDAMGGDLGLEAVVEGVARLTTEDNDIQVVLVGDADEITSALGEHRVDPRKLQVVHSGPAVAMDESPKSAIEQRP